MSLRSRITGNEQTDDEFDTDQATPDPALTDQAGPGDTAIRPTFTPAPAETDDVTDQTTVPRPTDPADDVAAQQPTLAEPADVVSNSDYAEPGYDRSGYGESGGTDYNAPAGQPVSVEPEQTARAYEAPETYEAPEAYEPAETYEPAEAYGAADVDTTDTPPAGLVNGAGKHAAPAVGGPAADGPLFTENQELRGQWQHIQAEFVDDPQSAVAGAADLVQQAGQALVTALQQRQERMRSEWDRDKANRTGTATDNEVTTTGGVDTEQLRQIMQRYRALFDQLSQPV